MKKEEYLDLINKYAEFEQFVVDRANRKYNVSGHYSNNMNFKDMDLLLIKWSNI